MTGTERGREIDGCIRRGGSRVHNTATIWCPYSCILFCLMLFWIPQLQSRTVWGRTFLVPKIIKCIFVSNVGILSWSTQSSDLNPIRHLQDDNFEAGSYHQTSVLDLTEVVVAEWEKIPAAQFQNVVIAAFQRPCFFYVMFNNHKGILSTYFWLGTENANVLVNELLCLTTPLFK